MFDNISEKAYRDEELSVTEIEYLLDMLNTDKRDLVYDLADQIREKFTGDEIFIRGIIEISNICRKDCEYCGIRRSNRKVERYRIDSQTILETAQHIRQAGQTTVVLQAGEDMQLTRGLVGDIIRSIKQNTDLAVTISLGERDPDTYRHWRDCGMDRYLLRFETTNREVFHKLHPDDDFDERLGCLEELRTLGVQLGSGFMIGLPGTDMHDLARDIMFTRELDLDMIGVGPFIPHPDTPVGGERIHHDVDFVTGVISILRIVNPRTHIPATTAFDTIHPHGRQLVLQRGANVFMPNASPKEFRNKYLLYPDKPCVDESAGDCANCVVARVTSIGRKIGKGPGHSIKKR